jgi:hypothetical protein
MSPTNDEESVADSQVRRFLGPEKGIDNSNKKRQDRPKEPGKIKKTFDHEFVIYEMNCCYEFRGFAIPRDMVSVRDGPNKGCSRKKISQLTNAQAATIASIATAPVINTRFTASEATLVYHHHTAQNQPLDGHCIPVLLIICPVFRSSSQA